MLIQLHHNQHFLNFTTILSYYILYFLILSIVHILNTYVYSILLCASECWTMSATMTKKLEAVEMWFYQRILRISYTKHITNEEVLSRMAATRNLIITVRGRQMSFFGHVMRNKEIESFSIS